MSSYLNYDGLVRVANKINTKFEAIATTTEEHADKILNLETNSATKEELNHSVSTAISAVIAQAPETLDTLNELAAALGDDPNFATTVATEIGKKVDQSSYNSFVGSVTSSIGSINEEIDSLQEASEQHLNKTDYLGPVIMEGNPVVYDNGVEGFDIKVESIFSPKQAGSGDPYPAGGGRNKLVFNSTGRTVDGIQFVANPADGSVVVKGTTTANNVFANLNYVNSTTSALPPGNYIVSGGTEKARVEVIINDSVAYRSTGNHVNFTIPENVTNSWVRIQINATGTQVDTVLYPMVRLATDTDESYAPPSNIRPIIGCDKLGLNHAGKNLCPYVQHNEVVALRLFAGRTYVVSIADSSASDITLLLYNDGTGASYFRSVPINRVEGGRRYGTFTLDRDTTHINFTWGATSALIEPQIEESLVVTPYEPYQGKLHTVQIGQTVYGGRFDWLTGKLVADVALLTLTGNEGVARVGTKQFVVFENVSVLNTPYDVNDALCSHFSYDPVSYGSTANGIVTNNRQIIIRYLGLTEDTGDAFKAFIAAQKAAGTPVQVAYKLAAPIEIQLTPTQISELEGINTLYGDGDSIRAIFKSTGGTSTTLESISGTLPVEKGGTGATSAAGARSNLGITPANIGALSTNGGRVYNTIVVERSKTNYAYIDVINNIDNTDYIGGFTVGDDKALFVRLAANGSTINSMHLTATSTNFSKPVAIGSGGTGATDAATARANLNVPSRTGLNASGDWGINITGNAATAAALTTSAGSSSQPIYFSSGKPVQVNNVWIGSATDATGRSFDIKRKNSSDASYGRLNIGMSSTGNTSFIEYLHYNTSGTEDQDNLLYISGNSFYPNANTTNLGTSSKKWGTVYATTFSGSGASLTSLNASNISSGTIAAARLPAATSSALGAVKIGSNISVSSGTISLTKSNVTTALGYTPPTVSYTDGSSDAGTIGTLKINSSSYTLKERMLNGTGASISDASITDLNTIKTPSVYYSGSSTVSKTLTNAPWTSSGFRLTTFAGYGGDSSYGLQVAVASSMMFWRNMGASNASPGPWYVVPQIPYTGNSVGSSTTPVYMDSNGKMIACTSPSMLVNLGSTSAANVFAASPRPGITGTLAISHGGTGATSKSGARTNLGITSGTSLPSSASAGDIFFLYS